MKKKKEIVDLETERYGYFMSQNSIDLDIMYGRNFLKTDNVQYVILHKIDLISTSTHRLYGQSKAKDKKFFAPVKLSGFIKIEESKQNYYGDNKGIVRDDTGNLVVSIYLDELKEKNVEIDRGDILEYNLSGEKARFYEVENANAVPDTSDKTIGGFYRFYKTIVAVPVKQDVIDLLMDDTKGEF
jgi:hypothetical protein